MLQVLDTEEKENMDLTATVQDLRMDRDRNAPVILQLEQDTNALATQISDMNKEYNKLGVETRTIKAQIQEASEDFNHEKVALAQVCLSFLTHSQAHTFTFTVFIAKGNINDIYTYMILILGISRVCSSKATNRSFS